jgi:prepilin-type N-terminal cleavage/methylation domain-containing protein
MRQQQKGFTLIEIAIVLVIIGLLLGGVLKGQELITGARVRNLIAQQDGIKAAYFGFLDRYRALPGDYQQATVNIPNVGAACTAGNGNGNGQIQGGAATPENILAWEHLSRAGFINGTYTCAPLAAGNAQTSPSNPYGGIVDLQFDATFQTVVPAGQRHNLKTGQSVPSDILAEVDRKVDDGNPAQGTFRAAWQAPAAAVPATCVAAGLWVAATPDPNCNGTTLF